MRTLYWIRDAAGAAPGGPEGMLRLAPAGAYRGGRWIAVRDGHPLLAALGVDPDGLETDLAGLRLVASEEGSSRDIGGGDHQAWAVWDVPTDARPLILADRRARRPWGPRALEGCSGERLADLVGLGTVGDLLQSFETINAADEPERAAQRARGRHVIVAGRAALGALGGEEHTVARLGAALSVRSIEYLAHPSGRSQNLNHAVARVGAAQILARALFRARGLPTAEDVRLERTWEHGHIGLRRGWHELRLAGLLGPGVTWADPWEPMPRQMAATARMGDETALWQVWPDGRVLAIGKDRTDWLRGRARWIGALGSPRERVERVGRFVDAEDAALATEAAARTRGWRSPWETRNAALAPRETARAS